MSRIGKFHISDRYIDENNMAEFFALFDFKLKDLKRRDAASWCFIGQSPRFDEIAEGADPPLYSITAHHERGLPESVTVTRVDE